MELEEVKFSRSLWPIDKVVGDPELVIFSNRSVKAFSAVVYIRRRLAAGSQWSTLLMSKDKIGPKNRVSILRIELHSAVLAERLREFLQQTLYLKFKNVYHLVDSSTSLVIYTKKTLR